MKTKREGQVTHLLTSSADSAIKNPCVAVSNFTFEPGFMAKEFSFPSSARTSMANSSRCSLAKQSLKSRPKTLYST